MTDKTKKIIAREGLVILGVISLGIFFASIPAIYILIENFINKVFINNKIFLHTSDTVLGWTEKPLYISMPESIGYFLLFFSYPLYLLTRFIIWAVRTLKTR